MSKLATIQVPALSKLQKIAKDRKLKGNLNGLYKVIQIDLSKGENEPILKTQTIEFDSLDTSFKDVYDFFKGHQTLNFTHFNLSVGFDLTTDENESIFINAFKESFSDDVKKFVTKLNAFKKVNTTIALNNDMRERNKEIIDSKRILFSEFMLNYIAENLESTLGLNEKSGYNTISLLPTK